MISLKKHIELHPGKLLDSALNAFRSSVEAMATSGARAFPTLGFDLKARLSRCTQGLSDELTPESLAQTGKRIAKELKEWGEYAAVNQQKKTADVKEIMMTLARTADIIADRDRRYAGQFGDLTGSLKAIATLDDVSRMRQSILLNAAKLSTYVERLTQENEQSVNQLRQELTAYQSRLDEAEQLASRDELTGLSNRRYTESQIQARITRALPFCILVLDLNGFKHVNDVHGHMAGDSLLREFASRLRSALRSSDVIGRWGGDEFVVILDCDAVQSSSRIVSINKKVAGGYQIDGPTQVSLTAAIGLAAWLPGDTMPALFERADYAMYEQKRDARLNATARVQR